jgi:hypothetical protein
MADDIAAVQILQRGILRLRRSLVSTFFVRNLIECTDCMPTLDPCLSNEVFLKVTNRDTCQLSKALVASSTEHCRERHEQPELREHTMTHLLTMAFLFSLKRATI